MPREEGAHRSAGGPRPYVVYPLQGTVFGEKVELVAGGSAEGQVAPNQYRLQSPVFSGNHLPLISRHVRDFLGESDPAEDLALRRDHKEAG